jgi:uncharacterized protein YebE (UPF0316 family)
MDVSAIADTNLFIYVILPILIFLARICDVTIGTVRILFIARGNKIFAPILGFFEVLIWLLAIRQIMQNLENAFCYLAYAGGFAMGNFVGIKIEEKVAYGKLLVRIITNKDASALFLSLRDKGFGVTKILAEGSSGQVYIIYTIIDRTGLNKVIRAINHFDSKAFYTIEDVRSARKGIFPKDAGLANRVFPRLPRLIRHLKINKKFSTQKRSE